MAGDDRGVVGFALRADVDDVPFDSLKVFEAADRRSDELPLGIRYPRGLGVPQYFVVDMVTAAVRQQTGVIIDVANICSAVVERVSATGGRILRADGFSEDRIQEGLKDGSLIYFTQQELLEMLDREKVGLSVTGGGDAAGIADCLAALAENLQGGKMIVGVRNAASGLIVPEESFDEGLILVDNLLVEDLKGQASTPFGSARVHAINGGRENTLKNIGRFGFLCGTGGNGQLGLFIEVAKAFPDKVVVSTPKTVDGDVCVNGEPVQALGFDTAIRDYQRSVWDIAQSIYSHREVTVVEVFGRNSGRLAFESSRRDPRNFDELAGNPAKKDLVRKIREFGDTVMILVPERPTSRKSIAQEVAGRKQKFGSCVVVVAEGFIPTDFIDRFKDGAMIRNVGRLVMDAIRDFAGIEKVRGASQSYEARGATPSHYDQVMGAKCGRMIADLVNRGVTGGKVVVYPEGVDVLTEEPVVMDLREVSDKNTLRDGVRYPDKILEDGGVFWEH